MVDEELASGTPTSSAPSKAASRKAARAAKDPVSSRAEKDLMDEGIDKAPQPKGRGKRKRKGDKRK
jgi:hypothetical protein